MHSKLTIDHYTLAYQRQFGDANTVIFCPGFNSSMEGNKALALESYCFDLGLEYIRFDYRGHGLSGGDFADGTISAWLHDVLSIIDELASHDVILVGSSMGAWIALLAALARPDNVTGLLLIACAADMTKYYPAKLADLQSQKDEKGRVYFPIDNRFDDAQPYRIYQSLLDDGKQHLLLHKEIVLDIPVSLIHGKQDDVVSWQRSQELEAKLGSEDVDVNWIEDGDHRLSRPQDLAVLKKTLRKLVSDIR